MKRLADQRNRGAISLAISGGLTVILVGLSLPFFDTPVHPEVQETGRTQPQAQKLEMKMEIIALPLPPPPVFLSATMKAVLESPKPAEATPEAAPKTNSKIVVANRSDSVTVSEGRVLLKLLETGKGPNVEIAWPHQIIQQDKLFNAFQTCLGLRTGLMTGTGEFYLLHGTAGSPALINPDETSLFLRQIVGKISKSEQAILSKIKKRHAVERGQPVRLFNRVVDAALLGALAEFFPKNSDNSLDVRAHYGLSSNAISVENISINGEHKEGTIRLGLGLLGKCR